MKASAQIAKIDHELCELGNWLARLVFLEKLCRSEKVLKMLAAQEHFIRLRITRAQAEIRALETAYFAEIQKQRRDAKYPPIKAKLLKLEII